MAGGTADIGIRVFLDDAALGGLSNINNALGSMGRSALGASRAMGGLSASMAGVGVAVGFGVALLAFGAAIKYSIDAASAFQQSMFSVAVATHVPLAAAMQYSNVLMNLAANSTYTSAQIADGIVQMGRAGYGIKDIFNGMATAGIALGIATRTTAVQGFTMLTQAMAAYNAPAAQAMHYADLLQFAFEHQRGSVSELTSGLSAVTPAAAQFGIPLREIVAALDVVGPAMKSTSVAGTALRYMIQGLYTPTDKAQTEMIALGLGALDASGKFHSAFYNARGQAVDFATAVHILSDHLKGLTQEDRMAALRNLFSVRGGQGADILLGNISKLDAYLRQLQQTGDNAGGAMRRWNEVMQTSAGAWAGLRSSVNDLAVAIGVSLLPVVTRVATFLNQLTTAIRNSVMANPGAASSFLKLGAAMAGVGLIATILILAISGVGGGILAFIGIVAGVAAGVVLLTVGIMMVANWIRNLGITLPQVITFLTALGVAALIVAGVFAGIQVVSLVAAFSAMAPALAGLVVDFALLAGESVVYAASVAASVVASLALRAAMIAALLPAILDVTIAWLLEGAAMLIANAPMVLLIAVIAAMVVGLGLLIAHLAQTGQLAAAWRAVWAAIGPILAQAGEAIRGALLQAIQQLTPVWNQLVQAFNQARPVLMLLGAVLGGIIVVALTLLLAAVVAGIVVFAQFIVMVVHVAAGIIQAFAGLIGFFLGLFTVIHGIFTGNMTEIRAGFQAMGNGIKNIFLGLWSAVSAIFVGAFNIIVGAIKAFAGVVIGVFHALSSTLVGHSIIPDMMNAIRNAIVNGLNAIVGFIGGIINRIIAFFVQLGSRAVSAVTSAFNTVRSVVSGALNAVVGLVGSIFNSIVSRVVSAGAAIRNAVSSAFNTVRSVVSSALSAVVGLVGFIFNSIVSRIVSAGASIRNAVSSAFNTARSIVQSNMAFMGAVVAYGWAIIVARVSSAGNAVRNAVSSAFNAARSAAASALASIVGVVSSGFSVVVSRVSSAGAFIVSRVSSAFNSARAAAAGALASIVGVVSGGMSAVIGRISSAGSSIIATMSNAWNSARNAAASGVAGVVGLAASLPGRVVGAIGGLAGMLYSSGAHAMQSFAAGLQSALGAVVNAVASAAASVASFLHHSAPPSVGPLSNDDEWMPHMMQMMAAGIDAHAPLLKDAINRAAGGMVPGFSSVPQVVRMGAPSPASINVAGGGGSKIVQIVVDRRILGQAVMNEWTSELQLNGGGRAFR